MAGFGDARFTEKIAMINRQRFTEKIAMTNRHQQRGIVLIAVLSMLTVVISLSAAYVLSVSRDSESLDMLNARIQARYSAYSGIEYGQS